MRVLLLRHAEASSIFTHDFDRSLTERGKLHTIQVAESFKEIDLENFEVYVSPARRTIETWTLISESRGLNASFQPIESLYSADTSAYVQLIARNSNEDLVIVGHNPAVSEVAHTLCSIDINLSTGDWALIDFHPDTQHGILIRGLFH